MSNTDPYPNLREFGPGSTTCADGGFRGTGCAVCATADVLIRWNLSIPHTSGGYPDMNSLGKSMGRRHRAEDPRVRHGLSLVKGQGCAGGYWCSYCAFGELHARGVPVAYGPLTISQIFAQLDAGHAVVTPGDYWQVPRVSAGSFDAATPAHGRVQAHLSTRPFGHMVVAWRTLYAPTEGRYGVVISDPDFGSSDATAVPPHSIWSDTVYENFWRGFGGGLGVAYTLVAPPSLVKPPKPPASGVNLRKEWAAVLSGRGSYLVPKGVNIRRDPHVAPGNVFRTTTEPSTFAAAQTAYNGTNVRINGKGTSLWLGTKDGNCWVLKSLCKLIGHTTGKEDFR